MPTRSRNLICKLINMAIQQDSIQLLLLQALATYKFLCLSQIEVLWIRVSKKTLSNHLNSLKERKLCNNTVYRFSPKVWKKEDVWYLLPKGKEFLVKYALLNEDEIKTPKWRVVAIEEYKHRKMTVSLHIAFRKTCDVHRWPMMFYSYDFERRKDCRSKRYICATKVRTSKSVLKSDSMFMININGQANLFCLELHNQYRVTRIVGQLKPYAYALAEGSWNTQYWFNKSPRILVVFEKESTLYSALEVLSSDTFYLFMKDYFLLNTYENAIQHPFDNWLNLNQE